MKATPKSSSSLKAPRCQWRMGDGTKKRCAAVATAVLSDYELYYCGWHAAMFAPYYKVEPLIELNAMAANPDQSSFGLGPITTPTWTPTQDQFLAAVPVLKWMSDLCLTQYIKQLDYSMGPYNSLDLRFASELFELLGTDREKHQVMAFLINSLASQNDTDPTAIKISLMELINLPRKEFSIRCALKSARSVLPLNVIPLMVMSPGPGSPSTNPESRNSSAHWTSSLGTKKHSPEELASFLASERAAERERRRMYFARLIWSSARWCLSWLGISVIAAAWQTEEKN